MREKNIVTEIALVFIISLMIGCGSTKEINHQGYIDQLQKTFKLGTDEFFREDYEDAKNLFTNYDQMDSGYFDYESYAFLAECYNKLGRQDSGKIIYDNVISKLIDQNKKPNTLGLNKIIVADLLKWSFNYPLFPDCLRKENGFVTYDIMPEPIGGLKAIQQNVLYPALSDKEKQEGKVLVLTLINENGKAIDFHIVQSLSEPYDDAAINAIRGVKFTIPKRKGRPHKTWVGIPVVFELH